MKKFFALAVALILGTGIVSGTACSHRHEWGEWKTIVPATCERKGSERRDCKICEEYQSRSIEKAEHTISAYYSADGSRHWKVCSVCKQEFEAGEHEFSGDVCSVCHYDRRGTDVLQYEMNEDMKSYAVVGVLGSAPESVVIPDSYVGYPVTRIAKDAFADQLIMKDIVLPASLTEIESGAFKNCASLTQLSIPASVRSMQREAFTGCTRLAAVNVAEGNAFYLSDHGVVYDRPQVKFVYVPAAFEGEIDVPSTVLRIADNDFADCTKLQAVTVGANVEQIGQHAFRNCTSLKRFTVEGGNTKIGLGALQGCSSLTELELADTWDDSLTRTSTNPVTQDRSGDSYLGHIFGAESCMGTGSAVPASLKKVRFTGGVVMYNFMFYNCTNIEELEFPATVTTIEDQVLNYLTALKSVTVSGQGGTYYSQDGVLYRRDRTTIFHIPKMLEGEITIPEGITQIGAEAFMGRPISSVSLPATVTSIGAEAFSDCKQLQTVTIPEESSLVSFGDYCFFHCEKLGSILIPATVTSIGRAAFVGCTALINAVFKATDGWKRSQSTEAEGASPVEASALANPVTAAKELTGAQSMYYWSRKAD